MRMRSLLKGAGLVAAAAALIVLVTLAGLLAFVAYNTSTGRDWSAPVGEVSRALTWDGTAYVFTGEDLLEDDRWAMLLYRQSDRSKPPLSSSRQQPHHLPSPRYRK